jgi:stage III sporulation protein AB
MRIFVKIIGAFLVFGGGCGMGWYFSAKKKQRIHVLQELEQVILLLYGEIEYAGEDMVETLEGLVLRTDWFSSFFQELAFHLRRKCGQPLGTLWEKSIENSPLRGILDKEDCRLWRELGSKLGTLDRQSQLRSLELTRQRLGGRLKEAQEEYRSQEKLLHVLGVTIGVFVVVLLL